MAPKAMSTPRRMQPAVTPPLIFLVFLVLLWKVALWNDG